MDETESTQTPEICWFCKKNPATQESKIMMNKITGGRHEGNLGYTYYQTCETNVKMCKECSQRGISFRTSCIGWLVGFLGLLALLIPWGMNPHAYNDYFILLAISPILLIPALIRLLYWIRIPRGIRATNWSLHRYPTMKALLKEKWMLGDKPYPKGTPPAFTFVIVIIVKPILFVFQSIFDFLDDLRSGRHD
jgi:hypothetical protein